MSNKEDDKIDIQYVRLILLSIITMTYIITNIKSISSEKSIDILLKFGLTINTALTSYIIIIIFYWIKKKRNNQESLLQFSEKIAFLFSAISWSIILWVLIVAEMDTLVFASLMLVCAFIASAFYLV